MPRALETRAVPYDIAPDSSSSDDDEARSFRSKREAHATTKPRSNIRMFCCTGMGVVILLALVVAIVTFLKRQNTSWAGSDTKSPPISSILNLVSDAEPKGGPETGSDRNVDSWAATAKEATVESLSTSQATNLQGGALGVGAGSSSTRTIRPSSSSNPSSPSPSLPVLYGRDLDVDFGTLSSADELASYLDANGLRISSYGTVRTIGPILHGFYREIVGWTDGSLRLTVKGQRGDGEVSSAEFETKDQMLYGRVTTRMKASPVQGVCHGIFWYGGPELEVDIELLTSYYTEGRGDLVKSGLQLTNHPTESGEGAMENMVVPYPSDPTKAFHDYTIGWTEEETIFEFDGEEVGRLKVNVPRDPMSFVWNSWSSGEPNWSAGPPTEDSYMLVSRIVANWTVVG